ncbi:DUF397 domain-containing protein [Streptomyces sp. WAC06614]|uniref:DUF397 domain-containing protein n=1 Tax=Streptomyces sp. WAC06614 TaxID=2487416 RepID=UPI000F76CACC|nr:DUF397 domain-containing protein [Streptomyces sp. WAC06614]RSS79615.1 DUF397 domain-containing protein [Streptomyces sp. WAC06614]
MSTLQWFKSSYSSADGDNCVEVALSWHRSTYSSADGDDCVEVAPCAEAVHVRDSKVVPGPEFAVSPDAWTEFLGYATA